MRMNHNQLLHAYIVTDFQDKKPGKNKGMDTQHKMHSQETRVYCYRGDISLPRTKVKAPTTTLDDKSEPAVPLSMTTDNLKAKNYSNNISKL